MSELRIVILMELPERLTVHTGSQQMALEYFRLGGTHQPSLGIVQIHIDIYVGGKAVDGIHQFHHISGRIVGTVSITYVFFQR